MRKLSTITYILLIIVAIGICLVSYHTIAYDELVFAMKNNPVVNSVSVNDRIKAYKHQKSVDFYATITSPFLIILLILYFNSPKS